MKALLVHNYNLNSSLIEQFGGDKFSLDYYQSIRNPNFSIDRFFHEELEKIFKNKKYEVIFLPYTLSIQNYLELTGLRFAAHIRLSKEFNHHLTPIVFIGPESPEQIAKLSNLGSILFTSGIFTTTKQDVNSINEQYKWIINNKPAINEIEYQHFLERIIITPPDNYQSHHSIDNELALVRWSEYLGCDSNIPEVKKNLQTGLYFKYHKALYPIKQSGKGKHFPLNGQGKILLIDDEALKGWAKFYECFFSSNLNNKSISLETLQIDYKISSQEQIIDAALEKFSQKENLPDVVLLDLRLCDADFKTNPQPKPEELTGYKILQEIKKINRGIQVIITTASNKAWNYELLLNVGANGYIIKRADNDVADDIKRLKNTIEQALKKANFLKKVFSVIEEINKYIHDNNLIDESLKKELENNYTIAYDMLEKAFDNEKYYNYSYLQLFICIEEFLKIKDIFEYGDKCYLNKNIIVAEKLDKNKWKSIIKHNESTPSYWTLEENDEVINITTDFKMSCYIIFNLNQQNSKFLNWPDIRDIRNNKAAHPEKGRVTKKDIEKILEFQKHIFNDQNMQQPTKSGLSDEITVEDINKLKQKFGNK
jgi:CheY-like chemotaxis protein